MARANVSFGDAFAAARSEGRALLLPYLMAGLVDTAASVSLFAAMAEAGADGFEIGMPYADPLMDGPVIQEAGKRALAAGMTLHKGLEVIAAVTDVVRLPVAVMTYVNPVLHKGAAAFCRAAADAGAAALIVADLPVDESAEIAEACRAAGIGLVQFAAPTTATDRLRRVVDARPPFVYGIAEMGVTGERRRSSSHGAALVARIRALSDIPVVLGVGISGPEAAADAAALADGVIVGSALVRRVLDAESVAAAASSLSAAVADLARAVRVQR